MPGFEIEHDTDEDDDQDITELESEDDGDIDYIHFAEIQIPQRISCFAHTVNFLVCSSHFNVMV